MTTLLHKPYLVKSVHDDLGRVAKRYLKSVHVVYGWPLRPRKTLFYTHAPLSSNKLVFGGVITILSNVPAELDLKLASCYCKVDGVVGDLYWYIWFFQLCGVGYNYILLENSYLFIEE